MNIRLHKTIYFYLALVLILTTLLQISRLDTVVQWSKNSNDLFTSSKYGTINALSEAEVASLPKQEILLIYDEDDPYSMKIKFNIEKELQYMKKPYTTVEIEEFSTSVDAYNLVIIAFSELDNFPDMDWIESFVQSGGIVFFANFLDNDDNNFYRIYRKLGIYDFGSYSNTTGVSFQSNILLGYRDREFNDQSLQNVTLHVSLEEKCIIHATTQDIPLLWETPFGKGKFIIFNGTFFQEKVSRGVLSGALRLVPDYIHPILNMKLLYIDDFPAPFPVGFHKKIYEEYKMNNEQFFKEVWWPDMLRLASLFNLKYTAGVIETYNNQVNAPFHDSGSDLSNLIIFGREIIKSGGEIGLHGYNHQSLVIDPKISHSFGYNSWPDEEDMVESIRTLLSFVQSVYPQYSLQTYIPPSNVLSNLGREALKEAWPELKNISSVYAEDETERGYVQEYEVASDGIVELPRITSGFFYSEYNQWMMVNAVSSIGVFSHFVHPDDLIDNERGSTFTWENLIKEFTNYLSFVNENYGWMRSLTASEASTEVEKYMMAQVYFDQQPDRILGYMNHFTDGMYFILRTDKKITDQKDCQVRLIDDQTYLVHANKEKFEIGLSE